MYCVWGDVMAFISAADGFETMTLECVRDTLGIKKRTGHRAHLGKHIGKIREFDFVLNSVELIEPDFYIDQCSEDHYFDLFRLSRESLATKMVDVGVFLGGSSSILAGSAYFAGASLDLVDINEAYLRFTYERIRRTYPNHQGKIRMWLGDFVSYVRDVMRNEGDNTTFIHHDGSHEFYQVVKDLSSMSFVKEQIHSIIIQDTHLRGKLDQNGANFVDAAVVAVFGTNFEFDPVGTIFSSGCPESFPNKFEGNYFLPSKPEGMHILMNNVEFQYPHPTVSIEEFSELRIPTDARP